MLKQRVVFVHGTGAVGAAAWPRQHGLALDFDALFLRRAGYSGGETSGASEFLADKEIVLEALGSGGHVVAHDGGAPAAMLAAVEHPELVRSLVLCEPACLSLTAGLPVTDSYIAQHGHDAERPWEAPLSIVPGVPTLVLTGGWEPMYEEVAHYLAATGAIHRTAPGAHRPQDSAEGAALVKQFLRRRSSP
ncbi:alpha/beta fold hydrolase [Pseudarthrobacter sp. N5]|uniref:alpha/beta fold hydrolase n=1 Tax=Pseudarthrobacter sp. N5 TaxID=3418416 RepID=UPI003CF101E2